VDLLINFAYGMDFRRSIPKSTEKKQRKLDAYFGTNGWRKVNERYRSKNIKFRAEALINLYMDQLILLGYKRPPKGEEYKNYFPIHNTKNGLLYYMIYASKHLRGYDFCKKMRKSALTQREFDY
jgi:three-Cys-motif partner protein